MRRLARAWPLAALLLLSGSRARAMLDANGPNLTQARLNLTATVLPDGRVLLAGGDDSTSAYATAEIFDPRTGSLTAVASMNTARTSHAATLLPNGKVLVTGGWPVSGSAFATAELYDPVANTWTNTPVMASSVTQHTAILLKNGLVLLAGGVDGTGTATTVTQLYDPVANAFTATGSMGAARGASNFVLLKDGRVMAVGGRTGGNVTSTEIYDPIAGTWSGTASFTTGAYGYSSTVLPDGRVMKTSGFATNAVEIYSPTANSWSGGTAIPNSGSFNMRQYFQQALLPDGKVIVISGDSGGGSPLQFNSTEIYDPVADAWSNGPNLTQARYSFAAAVLPDGSVFIAGGTGSGGPYASTERLIPAPAAPTLTAGNLGTARFWNTATRLPNGKVLIVGGDNSGTYLSSAELYDPAARTFSGTASLPAARSGHTATLLPNGKVLIAGGTDGAGTYYASAYLYDPQGGAFLPTGSMATARQNHTATLLPNGRVLLSGGQNGTTSYIGTAEIYDPGAGAFLPPIDLITPRSSHVATLLADGRVLIAAGQTTGSSWTTAAELYDPNTGTTSPTGAMNTGRAGTTATLLRSGKVLVAAGQNGGGNMASAELYDPAAGTWSLTGAMAQVRVQPFAAPLPDGKVLVGGGCSGGCGSVLTETEVYDPASGAFYPAPSLQTSLYEVAPVMLSDGNLLLAGGNDCPSGMGCATGQAELIPYTEFDVFAATKTYRPTIATINGNPLVPPVNLNPGADYPIVGSTFTGSGYGSESWGPANSAGNLPRAYLTPMSGGGAPPSGGESLIDISTSIYGSGASSEQTVFTAGQASTKAFISIPPNLACGFYNLLMQTDAVPSTFTVVRVAPNPPSGTPGTPTFPNVGMGAVHVNFGASGDPGLSGYGVSYSSDNFADLISTVATPSGGTLNVTAGPPNPVPPLWGNTTYYFRVQAENCGGNGPMSAVASVATLAQPAANGSIALYVTSATLNWTPNPPTPSSATAEGYEVDASTAPDFTGVLISSLTHNAASTALTVSGLANGATNYFYRVGSLNWVDAPNFGPNAQASFPVDGGAINVFSAASGMASSYPFPNGAPISAVQVAVRQSGSNLYWDPTGMAGPANSFNVSATPLYQSAVFIGGSSGTWTYAGGALGGVLVDGTQYQILARAIDLNGTPSALPGTAAFIYDNSVPVSAVTQPAMGQASLNAFPAVSGTAFDSASGVSVVSVSISSGPNFGAWWDGVSSWVPAQVWINATITGPNTWTFPSGSAPPLNQLASGVMYDIKSRAIDAAGNVQTVGSIAGDGARFTYLGIGSSGSFGSAGGAVMASGNGQHEIPAKMAVDASGPYTYIVAITSTDANFGSPVASFLYKYNAAGTLAAGPVQIPDNTGNAGIVLDVSGNPYVSTRLHPLAGSDVVQLTKYDNALNPTASIQLDGGSVGNVSAMTSDGSNVYLAVDGGSADTHPKVIKYNSGLLAVSTAIYSAGAFSSGHGNSDDITLDPSHSNLFVAVSSSNQIVRRLLKYDPSNLALGPSADVDISSEVAFAPSIAVSTDNALVYVGGYDVVLSSEIKVSAHQASSLAYIKTSTTTGATTPFFSFAPVSLGVSPIGQLFVGYTSAYDGSTYPGHGDYEVVKFDRDLNFQLSQNFNGPASSTDVVVAMDVIDSSNVIVTGASSNGPNFDAVTVKMFLPGNAGASVAVTTQTLASSTVPVNAVDLPMLALGLNSQNNFSASINSLTVDLAGNAPAGNVQANWYRDSNGNGVYDPGVDVLLASGTFGASTPPSVTLSTTTSSPIGATTGYFFLTITYSSVTIGRQLGLAIPAPGSFGLSGGFIAAGTVFPIASQQGLVQQSLAAKPSVGGYQTPTPNPNPTGGFDTGLPLQIGQSIVVTASGTWTTSAYGVTTASGVPTLGGLDPNIRIGALVGRVGGGAWFQLSTSAFATANQTGDLILAMNDTGYQTTAGFQTIAVQVVASTSSRVWLGNSGVNQNASTNANWLNGVPPGSGDNVMFDGSASNQSCNWDLNNAHLNLLTMATSYAGVVAIAPSASQLTVASTVFVGGGALTLSANVSLIAQDEMRVKGGFFDMGSGPAFLALGGNGLSVSSGAFRAAGSGLVIGAINPNQPYPIFVGPAGSAGGSITLGSAGAGVVQVQDMSTLWIGSRAVSVALNNANFASLNFDNQPRISFSGSVWTGPVSFSFSNLGFDLNTSTNVDAGALPAGSTVTIRNAVGPRFGSLFDSDPDHVVSWQPDGGGSPATISGQIFYAGGAGGDFCVAAQSLPGGSGAPVARVLTSVSSGQYFLKDTVNHVEGGGPGGFQDAGPSANPTYTLSTLAAPNTYYVYAWKDPGCASLVNYDPRGGFNHGANEGLMSDPIFVPSGGSQGGINVTLNDWGAVAGTVINNSPQFGAVSVDVWLGAPSVAGSTLVASVDLPPLGQGGATSYALPAPPAVVQSQAYVELSTADFTAFQAFEASASSGPTGVSGLATFGGGLLNITGGSAAPGGTLFVGVSHPFTAHPGYIGVGPAALPQAMLRLDLSASGGNGAFTALRVDLSTPAIGGLSLGLWRDNGNGVFDNPSVGGQGSFDQPVGFAFVPAGQSSGTLVLSQPEVVAPAAPMTYWVTADLVGQRGMSRFQMSIATMSYFTVTQGSVAAQGIYPIASSTAEIKTAALAFFPANLDDSGGLDTGLQLADGLTVTISSITGLWRPDPATLVTGAGEAGTQGLDTVSPEGNYGQLIARVGDAAGDDSSDWFPVDQDQPYQLSGVGGDLFLAINAYPGQYFNASGAVFSTFTVTGSTGGIVSGVIAYTGANPTYQLNVVLNTAPPACPNCPGRALSPVDSQQIQLLAGVNTYYYEFDGEPAGQYYVVVASNTNPVAHEIGSSDRAQLLSGGATIDASFPVYNGLGTINGTLHYNGGQTVGQYAVAVATVPSFGDNTFYFGTLETATSGAFSFSGLPSPATYYMVGFRDLFGNQVPTAVDPFGYVGAPGPFDQLESDLTSIYVSTGATVAGQILTLNDSGDVGGGVTVPAAVPVGDLVVLLGHGRPGSPNYVVENQQAYDVSGAFAGDTYGYDVGLLTPATDYTVFAYVSVDQSDVFESSAPFAVVNAPPVGAGGFAEVDLSLALAGPPGPVAGFAGQAQSATSIEFTWNTLPGATMYTLLNGANGVVATLPDPTSYYFNAVAPNTFSPIIQIKASNSFGSGPSVLISSVASLAAQPGLISVPSIFVSSANLNWPANGNPAGTLYQVTRSTSATGLSIVVFSTTAVSAVDFGLLPNQSYFWGAQAVNLTGSSTPFSAPQSAVTLPPSGPSLIGSITYAGRQTGPFMFQVAASTSFSPIIAFERLSSAATGYFIAVPPSASYAARAFVDVLGDGQFHVGEDSASASATVLGAPVTVNLPLLITNGGTPPSAPTGLTVVTPYGQDVLGWNAPTVDALGASLHDLAGYRVYRSTNLALGFTLLSTATVDGATGTVPTASFVDLAPIGSTTGVVIPNYYRVTAVDWNGFESAPSAPIAATPFFGGTITGVVNDLATQHQGPLRVRLSTVAFVGGFVAESDATPFVFPNLPDGVYYVSAFRDLNGSGKQTDNDPAGTVGGLAQPFAQQIVNGNSISGLAATVCDRTPAPIPQGAPVPYPVTISNTGCPALDQGPGFFTTLLPFRVGGGSAGSVGVGANVSIQLQSSFPNRLILLGPNGGVVAQNADAGGASLNFTAAQTGLYLIEPTSFNPGDTGSATVDIGVTGGFAGTIAGNLSYTGARSGSYVVQLFNTPNAQAFPVSQSTFSAAATSYSIAGLPDGLYFVRAFRDVHGDLSDDFGDPAGTFGASSSSPTPVYVQGGSTFIGSPAATAGGSANITLTDPAGGTLSGNVVRQGSEQGTIYVEAELPQTPCQGGNCRPVVVAFTTMSAAGAYSIPFLPPSTSYILQGFVDTAGTGQQGPLSPQGTTSPLTVEANQTTNVGLLITDPGSGASGNATLQGTVSYVGVSTAPLLMGFATDSSFHTIAYLLSQASTGTYVKSGIAGGTSYYIAAFLDVDHDGQPDTVDPIGFYGASPSIDPNSAQPVFVPAAGPVNASFTIGDPPTGQVVGQVTYQGSQFIGKNIVVKVSDVGNNNGSYSSRYFTIPSASSGVVYGYSLPLLNASTSYTVFAFVDAAGNGLSTFGEPNAYYGNSTCGINGCVGQAIAVSSGPGAFPTYGINLTLSDPGSQTGALANTGQVTIEADYLGSQKGPLVFRLFTNSSYSGSPFKTVSFAMPPGPGTARLQVTNLPLGTYYIDAFRDPGGSGIYNQAFDAYGQLDPITLTAANSQIHSSAQNGIVDPGQGGSVNVFSGSFAAAGGARFDGGAVDISPIVAVDTISVNAPFVFVEGITQQNSGIVTTLVKYSSAGVFIASATVAPGEEAIDGPIAIDASGNAYLASSVGSNPSTGTLLKFSPGLAPLQSVFIGTTTYYQGLVFSGHYLYASISGGQQPGPVAQIDPTTFVAVATGTYQFPPALFGGCATCATGNGEAVAVDGAGNVYAVVASGNGGSLPSAFVELVRWSPGLGAPVAQADITSLVPNSGSFDNVHVNLGVDNGGNVIMSLVPPGDTNVHTYKFNPSLQQVAAATFGPVLTHFGGGIGNMYVASTDNYVYEAWETPANGGDYLALRYDDNLNLVSSRTFDGGLGKEDIGLSVAVYNSSNVFVTGSVTNANNNLDWGTVRLNMTTGGAQAGAGAVVSITTANAVDAVYGSVIYNGALVTSGTVRSLLVQANPAITQSQPPLRFSSAPFAANSQYLFNNVPAGAYQVVSFVDVNGDFNYDAVDPIGISSTAGFAFAGTSNTVLNVYLCDRRPIAFGQSLQTTIAPPDCPAADQNGSLQRLYTFSASRGQAVTISATPVNFIDAPLRLYDPSLELIAANDGGSGASLINGFILPSDGLYTIAVAPFSASITSATVKLSLGGGAGSLGSISGNAAYNGVEGGRIVLGLFSTSTFLTNAAGAQPVQSLTLAQPGPFSFPNLLTGSTYYLGGFIDVAALGRPVAGEDSGVFGSSVTGAAPILLRSGQNVTGVNFVIAPSSSALFADLSGVVTYAGQQTGPMHVELWPSAQFTGQPAASRVVPTGAGSYDVPAPGGLPYYLRAWLDAANTGAFVASDPSGIYAPLNQGAQAVFAPSTGTLAGLNFSIADPGALAGGGFVGQGSAAILPLTAPAGAQVFSATITYTAAGMGVGGVLGFTVPPGFPPPVPGQITFTSTAPVTFSAINTSAVSARVTVTAGSIGAGQQVKIVYTEGPVSCAASTQTWTVSVSSNTPAPQPLLAGSPAIQVTQGAPVGFQPSNPVLSLAQNALSSAQYLFARDSCGNQAPAVAPISATLTAENFNLASSTFVVDTTGFGVSTSALISSSTVVNLTYAVGQSSQPFYAISASTGQKTLAIFNGIVAATTFYFPVTALPGNALTNVSVATASFGTGASSATIAPNGGGASLAYINFRLGDPTQSWDVQISSIPFGSAAAPSPLWQTWGSGQPSLGQIAWDGRYSPWINGGARVPSGFYYVRVEVGGFGGVHDDSVLISVVVPQISGQFRDSGLTPNPPLAGANVQIYGPNGTTFAQTDSNGGYVLTGLAAGAYNMFVSRPNFLNATLNFTLNAAGAVSTFTAVTNSVAASTNAAGGLDVLMSRASVLFIVPSFAAGYSTAAADQYGNLQVNASTALAAAAQQTYFSPLHVAAGTTTFDDGGQWDPSAQQFLVHTVFQFAVAPGTYSVSALLPNFSPSSGTVYVANGLNTMALPPLASKSSVSGAVSVPSNPNGYFVSVNAVPLSTAAAAAGSGGGVSLLPSMTSSQYTIGNLAPGAYVLTANVNGLAAVTTGPITVPASSAVTHVDFPTLGVGASISGNVSINANTLGSTLEVDVSAWSPGSLNFGSTSVFHAGANGLVTVPYTLQGLSSGSPYQVFVNVGGTNANLAPQGAVPLAVTAPSAAANVSFAASSGAISGTITLPVGATDFANVNVSGLTVASARPGDVGHTFSIPSSTEIAQGGSGGYFLCEPSNAAPNATDGTCPAGNNTATFLVGGINTETDDVTFFYATTGQSQKVHLSVVTGSTTTATVNLSQQTFSISGSISNQISNPLFNTDPNIVANAISSAPAGYPLNLSPTTARVEAIAQSISQFNVAISTTYNPLTTQVGFLTAAGTWTITNLPSGVYFVHTLDLRACATCAVSVPSVGQLVNVAGASVSSVTLALADGFTVSGSISLDGGLQDARAFNVTVVNQRQQVVASTSVALGDPTLGVTANSVNYSFSNLPAGNFYTLSVADAGSPQKYVGAPINFPNPGLSPSGLQSSLSSQNVLLERAAYITGQLQDANSGLLINAGNATLLAANFQITATASPWVQGGYAVAASSVAGRPIQQDGTFQVGPLLPNNSYILSLTQQSWDPQFLSQGSQNYTPVTIAGLTPQSGQILNVGVVSLNQGQSLTGHVYASTTTGALLGNILITAQPSFGNAFMTVQTYTNPSGQYTLWVSTYASTQYDITAAGRDGNLASNGTFYTQVTLHAVNLLATTTADFVLNPLQVSVTGQIVVADAATGGSLSYPFGSQKGFPAAAVFMQPQNVVPTQNPLGDISAISDSLGNFSVTGLSTGTYSLRVVSLGYEVFNATVTASTGTYVVYVGSNTAAHYLANNKITLVRGATVTGRILQSDGSAPNTTQVGGIAAANFQQGEYVVGSVDVDPTAKTVNSYTISGFKTGIAYNIVILPADSRDDVVSPVEGQGLTFQAQESTTTKTINLTYISAGMSCVATTKALGSSQFQVKIDCNKDLRNVTSTDNDLTQILSVSTYTSAGAALVAPNGTGQLNGGDKKISADRKEITAIYRAANNETSFSLRLRATASTVDPKTGLNFATDQVFDFFTGLTSNVTNRIQNINGGTIQLQPSAQDTQLGLNEQSRIDLQPGTFAIGDASLPDSAVTASATTTITVGIAKAQDQNSASVLALRSLGYVPSSLGVLSNPAAFPAELGAAMTKYGVLSGSTSTIGGADPLSAFYNIFLPLGVRHQLKQLADITFSYNTSLSSSTNADDINVWFYNATLGQFVVENTNRRLDTTNKTITVSVNHFSVFVVLGGQPQLQAPNATPFSSIIAYNFPNPSDCGVHSNVQVDTALTAGLGIGATFPAYKGTMIRYSLPMGDAAGVTIRFYNLAGQLVKTIDQGQVQGGFTNYQNWDCTNNSGRQVASGVYIGEIQWGKQRKFFKTAIIRGSGL